MDELANELRRVYNDAPRGATLVAVQMFAIKNAKSLEDYRMRDTAALAEKAGLTSHYGSEIYFPVLLTKTYGVNIKPLFSEKRLTLDEFKSDQLGNTPFDLVDDLRSAYRDVADGEVVISLFRFGIKNADRIRGTHLKELIAASGLPASVYLALRKGRKLANHVEIID